MARFTQVFVKTDSPLHRLHPLTVATYVVCISLLGIVGQPMLLLGLFGLSTLLAWVGRVGRPYIGMMLRIIIPIAIPLFVIQTLFNPIGQTVLYRLGPFAVKQEGLDVAINIITRLLALVAAYFLLVLTVHPRNLVTALEQRGMSPKLGYLILSTLQLVPQILYTAETILDAQRSRGLSLKGNLLKRFRAYIPLMGPIVMGSLATLEIRAMALEARGFNLLHRKTYLRTVADTPKDRWLRWLMVLATLLLGGLSVVLRFQ